jgi:hypothetical protein
MSRSGSTRVWQVIGTGEGFVRNGVRAGFDLSGFVCADDPNTAWTRAMEIARTRWPELAQADAEGFPRAVVNANEIEDASRLDLDPAEVDRIAIAWEGEQ